MFTGFASENTPAIQVWDFFQSFASSAATRSVSLADDCAPVQIFRTGATTQPIRVNLPTCPIEGAQITITNQLFGGSSQPLQIYSSDVSGTGSSSILFTLGTSGYIVLVYSKQAITYGTGSGNLQSGWIPLTQGAPVTAAKDAVLLGGTTGTATGPQSAVVGGISNTASSTASSVVGGNTNTASGLYSFVIGGNNNSMARGYGGVVGGSQNSLSTSADYSVIVGGIGNTATNGSSVTLGGAFNTNGGNYGTILGGRYATTRGLTGSIASTANADGLGQSVLGSNQMAFLVVAAQTTTATPTVLTTDAAAAGTTNQLIMSNNSAYHFKGSIIAGVTAAGATSAWSFEGVIKRGASAAATSIVQSVINLVGQDTAASAWVFAISADTTNGGLAFTVTGAAATTIRWVCKIETTEMDY